MFPRENHSNGYEQQVGGMSQTHTHTHSHTHTHRERVRRRTRRSRVASSSHPLRVFDQSQPQHHRPPCTDFDVAYFHSYAHLGIHQEMIKVPLPLPLLVSFLISSFSLFTSCFPMQDRVRTETYREAIMQHQSFIAGKVFFHLLSFSLFSMPPLPISAI